MTRTESVTYCTSKLGITDATAVAQAGVFYDARWAMIWDEENWRQTRYQETIAVAAGTQDVTVGANCELVKACRWAGQQELLAVSGVSALAMNPAGYDASGPVLAFEPLGKNSSGQVQIRLLQIPTDAKNLLVIGKRKVIALAGGDTPPIPGATAVLNDLVMADLYEWLRQPSKSAYFLQKVYHPEDGSMKKMKDIETQQTAEICRIIPMEQVLDGDAGNFDSFNPLG